MQPVDIEKLYGRLFGGGPHPEDDCPSTDQLVDLIMGVLEPRDAAEVEERIGECEECVTQVALLREAAASFQVAAPALLDELRRRIRDEVVGTVSRPLARLSLEIAAQGEKWSKAACEILDEFVARLAAFSGRQPTPALAPGYRVGFAEKVIAIVESRPATAGAWPERIVFQLVRGELDPTGRLMIDLSLAPEEHTDFTAHARVDVRLIIRVGNRALLLPVTPLSPEGRVTVVTRVPAKVRIDRIPASALEATLSVR